MQSIQMLQSKDDRLIALVIHFVPFIGREFKVSNTLALIQLQEECDTVLFKRGTLTHLLPYIFVISV